MSKIIHRINSGDIEKALAEPQEMLNNEDFSSALKQQFRDNNQL